MALASRHPSRLQVRPGRHPWLVLAALLLTCLAGTAMAADGVALEVAQIQTDANVTPRQVLRGEAGPWRSTSPSAIDVPARAEAVHWIRLRAQVPEAGDWMLWLDKVPLTEIVLLQPGTDDDWSSQSRQFFRPDVDDPPLGSGFRFLIHSEAAGAIELLLQVRTNMAVSMHAELLPRAAFDRADRIDALLLAAIYAGLVVLTLNGLALYVALRDRIHGAYVGFCASGLLLLAAGNGHAFGLPLLSALGWWRELGLLALANLTTAFALLLVRGFAALGGDAPRCDRSLRWGAWLLFLLAGICLLNVRRLIGDLQLASLVAWSVGTALALYAAMLAWRLRRPLSQPLLFVWLTLFSTALARGLVAFGWAPLGSVGLYGFQLAFAFTAFIISLALADQVMEFRKQRDKARLAMERADASLQREKVRLRLIETLQSGLRAAPRADIAWIALRRLLDALRPIVPQRRAAVAVFNYHGGDLLLTEPVEAKAHFDAVLGSRGGTLRGLCRTQNPIQLRLDAPDADAATGGDAASLLAIVPLPLPRPSWGVLLIEREPWQTFEAEELREAGAFAAMAINAADEARATLELAERGDRDTLTGALNRKAIETQLNRDVEVAHARRQSVAALLVGIDRFAMLGERYGHACGNDCLCSLAEAIRALLRGEDSLGRFGDERFLVSAPGLDADKARALADRIRAAASGLRVAVANGQCAFTVSVGVSTRAGAEQAGKNLLARVESALDTASQGRGNQTHLIAVTEQLSDPGTLPFA